MAYTNFANLTNEEKTMWSMDMWRHARNLSFINQFTGSDQNAMVQRITELTPSQKGARAVITLLADLVGDGVTGDNQLEGNEEAQLSYEQVIRIDQMRHATRIEGRLADQKSIVNFRETSRNNLAYWMADRLDQLAFLTLSGVSYGLTNKGAVRTGSNFVNLEFAADVAAPSSQRVTRWDNTGVNTGDLITSGVSTADVAAADTITWESLVRLKAYAKDQYIRGLRPQGGLDELFHVFMSPKCLANLKMDDNYMQALRHSTQAGVNQKLFGAGTVMVDGLVIHEHRHVFTNENAATQWGAGSDVEGCQVLMCGAQALALADMGAPDWTEKYFDYDNQSGIAIDKMVGLLKPRFNSIYSGNTVQDYGVVSMYVAH